MTQGHPRAGAVVDESNRRTRQRRAWPPPGWRMQKRDPPTRAGCRPSGAATQATRMS
ncbi:MFS transporter, partial [Xanthomonas oryzae pv. oryzae]